MAAIGKVAGAAFAGAFVIETKAAITTTQDLTKSTISLHKNLGLTNKVASEWASIAKARGADTTKLGMAFKTLATQISAAGHGSATSIAMFKELGFSGADIQKSMTDTNFAVGKVADGLNALPAGADKATISSKLFGRGWQTIAPVLRDGSAAMQEQLDTVEKYGAVLEGKTLQQQKALLGNIRENKIAWQGFQVTLASAVTPALNTVSNQFQHIAAIMANPKLTQDQKFSKVADIIQTDLSAAINTIVDMIPTVASNVGQEAPKIAEGFVKGFLGADVWGKLAIGAFLVSKMGGWGAIRSLGGRLAGTLFGTGAAGGIAGGIAGGATGITGVRGAGVGSELNPIAVVGGGAGGIFPVPPPVRKIPSVADVAKTAGETGLKGVGTLGVLAAAFGISAAGGAGTQGLLEKLGIVGPFDPKAAKKDRASVDLDTLRQKIKVLASEEGKLVPIGKILRAKLDPAALEAAGVAIDDVGKKAQQSLDTVGVAAVKNGTISRKEFVKLAKQAGESSGQINRQLDRTSKKLDTGLGGSYTNLAGIGLAALTNLAGNTNKALRAVGAKAIPFNLTSLGKEVLPFARGGLVPGSGTGDTVHTMLTPGEGVIRKEVVAAMGGAKAIDALNAQHFAAGGVVQQALGPYTIPPIMYDPAHAGSNSHVHADFFTIPQALGYGHKMQQMGWSIGEYTPKSGNPWGFGPITVSHQSPGHYDGTAFDANTAADETRSQVAAVARLFNSGQMSGAMAQTMLKRIVLGGPAGALRTLGQASLDTVRGKANAFLRRKSTPTMQTTGRDSGAGMFGKGQLANLWTRAGGSAGIANLMAAIALAESGGDPNIVNSSSGASGLWQILGQIVPGNILNPFINAENAVAKYRTQGLGAWEAYTNGSYLGFKNGGTVPGRIGEPQVAVVHGGEKITPPGQTRYALTITNWRTGEGYIREIADEAIDDAGAHDRNLSRMGR